MNGPLRVLDDERPDTLTRSDIRELKRLANASRIARWALLALAAVITFVGFDHVVGFVRGGWRS